MQNKYVMTDDYSLSRNEYYQQRIFPRDFNSFSALWQFEKSIRAIDLPVIFRGIPFGGSPKMVARQFGEPRFVAEQEGISSRILFFKEKINNYSVLTQMHFMADEFFYACYTFRNENNSQRQMIRRILYEKYCAEDPSAFQRYTRLIDKSGNIISVFDDVHFNIIYLWGHEKVKAMLSSSMRAARTKEDALKRKNETDLRSKL